MKNTFTDEELVYQFVEDKETASFNELYQRYNHKVYQSCLRFLENSEEAHDQVQEVFCKVFSRLPAFRHQSSFSTWLYTITRNHCFNLRQQQARSTYRVIDYVKEPSTEVLDDEPITLDERWQAAEQVLSQLSAYNRRLLRERYVVGKDIADMANENQVSISAMKMRLKRARDVARTLYAQCL
ncbi:sigma-70 family RNA polymerase sigma factor [Spirosoma sp. BT702]|uniref:Sigma-70 family RNA polymerase sigma factor n=1 Tax=Spirosoma profusum TaxID=2771354 RepID=A0A926XXQ7_9BACT|nr:sigma-70 family RNA polymerase sigma factor [Spirosoma profusum]MBD2702844.1 sigma-70 family RNA polymerase sigma factor [Spirosoma profusum]